MQALTERRDCISAWRFAQQVAHCARAARRSTAWSPSGSIENRHRCWISARLGRVRRQRRHQLVPRDTSRAATVLVLTGWALGCLGALLSSRGLAISDDGGRSFTVCRRPLCSNETPWIPYLTASPWVLVDNGVWRMWYIVSATGMENRPHPGPTHHITCANAESRDGVNWARTGHVCLDFRHRAMNTRSAGMRRARR
jgi:hypothetical protein